MTFGLHHVSRKTEVASFLKTNKNESSCHERETCETILLMYRNGFDYVLVIDPMIKGEKKKVLEFIFNVAFAAHFLLVKLLSRKKSEP